MAKCEDYVYLPLVDARKAVDVKVNLFAVVVKIGAPTRSKGTCDYFLELRIADQSYMASSLSVNFFAESTAKLPHVMSPGDIICLHRVVPRVYQAEVYFAFEKNLSSFALFGGKCDSSLNPYQASYNFHAMEHNMDLIKKLRTWSLDYHADADAKNYTLQLKEIEVDLEIDLICRVLHVCEAGEDERIIYVWDGTDCPPLPVQTENYNERIMSDRPCQPMSCFSYMFSVTETDFFHFVDATLMDSLAHPEVTHNCKCVVRVVAACPWRAKDFISLQRGKYRLRLTLEDPTARIHAYICGDDGVKFFGENSSVENLDTKMSKLLGIPQEPFSENSRERKVNSRDPPWVEICLRSYYLDVDRPRESRRYRIFATELLD